MTLLTVTISGLLLRGPAIVRWEVATTPERGFQSIALVEQFGTPGPEAIWTSQEFGLWNGVEFQLDDGAEFWFRPTSLPVSLRWRLTVNGVVRTHPAGVAGWAPLDQNLDAFTDPIDYALWMNWYAAGDGRADFNADGFVDPIDYAAWNQEWLAQ